MLVHLHGAIQVEHQPPAVELLCHPLVGDGAPSEELAQRAGPHGLLDGLDALLAAKGALDVPLYLYRALW